MAVVAFKVWFLVNLVTPNAVDLAAVRFMRIRFYGTCPFRNSLVALVANQTIRHRCVWFQQFMVRIDGYLS